MRAWYGNSHIGNRPVQARAYYDLARSVQPGTICEVGFNGGHSADRPGLYTSGEV